MTRPISWAATALCAILWAVAGPAAQGHGDAFTGTWTGVWDGAGSGNFTLTLDRTGDGSRVGRVAVTTDGGNYDAELKAIAIDGAKLTARYDFPLDGGSEIVLAATFEGASAKGTWSLRPKGQDTESAGGTWTVTKK
jgi:hypothetical protein